MKVLHCGDLHLREKDIEESKKCLRFVEDTAQALCVDLIVIAGDTFDSRDIKLDSQAAKLAIKTVSALADVAPVFVIVGTPSHDGTSPEVLQYARGRFPVMVATKPEQIVLPNAVLTLIPQPTKQYFNQGSITESNESISMAMNGLFAGFGAQAAQYPDAPHILVGHWEVTGARLPTGQTMKTGQDISITTDQMMLANPDLNCLGHIHMRQQLGDRTFYPGSLFPLNWGENTEHGFYIHTLDGKKLVSSEFIQTPCKKLARFQVDFTEEIGVERCFDLANDGWTDEEGIPWIDLSAGSSVRFDLTVWQDEATKIDKDAITKYYLSIGATDVDIRIIRVPRQTVRSETVLKSETLRDKLIAMAALTDETVPESILQKADALETMEPAKLMEVA